MASHRLSPFGQAIIPATSNTNVAVYSKGTVTVSQTIGLPNQPTATVVLGSVTNGQQVFAITGTSAIISGGAQETLYNTGDAVSVMDVSDFRVQGNTRDLNASGAIDGLMITNGIVMTTTVAAVTGTLATGQVLSGSILGWKLYDAIEWSVINIGGTNALTVAGSAGHTFVGAGAVAANTSARFLTRKSGDLLFETYRIA